MEDAKAKDLIARGIADEYKGEFPPKNKTKFDLKNLTDGKNNRQNQG